jgi:hypothetical protein
MNFFARARLHWQDFWSVLLSGYPVLRAGRHYGKAFRLDRAGRHAEAFELTTRALASLPDPERSRDDATVGARLGLAVLHAQLAARLGRPELAQPEIRKALGAWGDASVDHPAVREHLNWLRSQLKDTGNDR